MIYKYELVVGIIFSTLCVCSSFLQFFRTSKFRFNSLSQPVSQPFRNEVPMFSMKAYMGGLSPFGTRRTNDAKRVDLTQQNLDFLLEAVKIFKIVYGDLDITNSFVVPSSDSWPEQYHGLPLGKYLESVLSSSHVQSKPGILRLINSTGLVPHVDSILDDWGVMVKALVTYKNVHGDVRVPLKFVVPSEDPWPRVTNGFHLGSRLGAVRSSGRFVRGYPERMKFIEDLGLEAISRYYSREQSIGDTMFELIFRAYERYADMIDKELDIPSDFCVPIDDNWPPEMWGLELGHFIQTPVEKMKLTCALSHRENKLDSIGFPWSDSLMGFSKAERKFELTISALEMYQQIYGNLDIPVTFIVPRSHPWSKFVWDMRLGHRLESIRNYGLFVRDNPRRQHLLSAIGFDWNLNKHPDNTQNSTTIKKIGNSTHDDESSQHANTSFDLVLKSEVTLDRIPDSWLNRRGRYKRKPIHRNLVVPNLHPSVLYDDHSPADFNEVDYITSAYGGPESSRYEMSFDPSLMFHNPPLRDYVCKKISKHRLSRESSRNLNVRKNALFEYGYSLDEFNEVTKNQISNETKSKLQNIGYRILEFGKYNWDIVVEALQIYKSFFGNVSVPYSYKIDRDVIAQNIGFRPRHFRLPLGKAVYAIQVGDVDAYEDIERKSVLDELKFEWPYLDRYLFFRYHPMILGLRIFFHLHSHCVIPYDFVIEDEPTWPIWMKGMPLGEWTDNCRAQESILAKHFPGRIAMLNDMEFPFWLPGTVPMPTIESRSANRVFN